MDIKAQIRQYIAENLLFSDAEYPYDDDASFLEEQIIDSLGILEVVCFVEERFGVCILDHELIPDNFDSVNKLAAYITRKQTHEHAKELGC